MRHRLLISIASAAVTLLPWAALGQNAASHVEPSDAARLTKDAAEFRSHITILASPFMEGRAPGTRGNRIAAEYLEFNVKRLGLLPAFPLEVTNEENLPVETARSSYRQPFTAPSAAARPTDVMHVKSQSMSYVGPGTRTLETGKDFNVLGYSGAGSATGELAFVGYAIVDGKDGYSSFGKGADLTGKVAMVLRFEPMDDKGHSRWTDVRWSANAALDSKMRAVESRGASAVILVNPPGADDERAGKLEDLSLSGAPLKIPVVMLTQEAAEGLVKAADEHGRSLMEMRQLADAGGGVTVMSKAKVKVNVDMQRTPPLTDNVGAILPGSGALANEFVVVGSHYDHIGYGYFGSRDGAEGRGKIHPGADDNASGSCGNLLVANKMAEAYAAMPAGEARRSVLFLWFSAEESGLNGSAWYVRHPIVPLNQHAIMLNMDMIGRLREGKLEVGGVGSAEGLADWTKPYWEKSGLTIKPTRMGAPNSDHYSFQLKGVPNLFFFTGLHTDYHTMTDTIETVNMEGAAQVADLVYRVALDAATRKAPFEPTSSPKDEKEQPAQGPLSGVKVRFGIMPGNYADDVPGILIGGLSGADLPAAKAGLKSGDRMTKWNGEAISNVEGWMTMLEKAKPGDKVRITYTRTVDGKEKEMTTEAVLVAAPSGRVQ